MKKTNLFILFVLAAMILGIAASASAASLSDFWGPIDSALGKIEGALDAGNIAAAQGFMTELRNAVYAGEAFMVKNNCYDPRVEGIITYANQAIGSADHSYLIAQAAAINNATFGRDIERVTPSSHS